MSAPRTAHDLRCECSRRTKLAVFGVTVDGDPYVHVRVFKQSRVFGEVVATGGEVRVLCRDCGRWTFVNIVGKTVKRDVPKPAL